MSGNSDLDGVVLPDEKLYNANPSEIKLFQEKLMQQNLLRVAELHPIYSKIIEKTNINIAHIKTFEDLNAVFPVTSKEDFISDPLNYVLKSDSSNPKEYLNWDVTYTAGTSGYPAPVFQTTYDFKAVLFAHKRMAKLRGMTASDKIFNLYPLAPYPHGGWIRPTQAAAVIGAAVVVGMSGSTTSAFPILRRFDEVVELVAYSNPTILWGVPSYVLKVLRELEEKKLTVPNLRLLNVSGEPCGPKMRSYLANIAGGLTENNVLISDSLGATELQFSLVQCPGGNLFHNPAPEITRVSVVDENGFESQDGQAGKLTVTHLNRRGTVLIRYLLGDLATMDFESCALCGWTGGSIAKHLGREGNFLKVRGQMVNSGAIMDWLQSNESIIDYKIIVSNDTVSNLDQITIELVSKDDTFLAEDRELLVVQLSDIAGLKVAVKLSESKAIWVPENGMKPKRLEDRRSDN
jgi:phenylacetate-CoA ligase